MYAGPSPSIEEILSPYVKTVALNGQRIGQPTNTVPSPFFGPHISPQVMAQISQPIKMVGIVFQDLDTLPKLDLFQRLTRASVKYRLLNPDVLMDMVCGLDEKGTHHLSSLDQSDLEDVFLDYEASVRSNPKLDSEDLEYRLMTYNEEAELRCQKEEVLRKLEPQDIPMTFANLLNLWESVKKELNVGSFHFAFYSISGVILGLGIYLGLREIVAGVMGGMIGCTIYLGLRIAGRYIPFRREVNRRWQLLPDSFKALSKKKLGKQFSKFKALKCRERHIDNDCDICRHVFVVSLHVDGNISFTFEEE